MVGSGKVKESDTFGRELKSFSGFERSKQSTMDMRLENAEVLDVRTAEMDVENSSQGSPSGYSNNPNKNNVSLKCNSSCIP